MSLRLSLTLFLALAALSGCGRRGDLERPGTSSNDAEGVTVSTGEETLLDPGSPGAQQPPAALPTAEPERRFVLDPLI